MTRYVYYRRCPSCGQVERIDTGDVVLASNHQQGRCELAREYWEQFIAPPDWQPGDQD